MKQIITAILALLFFALAGTVNFWLRQLLSLLGLLEATRPYPIAAIVAGGLVVLALVTAYLARKSKATDSSVAVSERAQSSSFEQEGKQSRQGPISHQTQENRVISAEQMWRLMGRERVSNEWRVATEAYFDYLSSLYRYLNLKGMGISDRLPLQLLLLDLYVPLKARIEIPKGQGWAQQKKMWARQVRIAGRAPTDDEVAAMGERVSQPLPVMELLQENNGMIILGDPGAGKTTVLRFLGLMLIHGKAADLGLSTPFPLYLPVAAYADELSKRNIGILDFAAYYYEQLIDSELSLEPVFKAALAQGGALILLDGLDEVKQEQQRQQVINNVLEFYEEHRQQGNKFVLTSRLVGYAEVRPVAEGLTECTLVDFEDVEIKEFIDKWTKTLERAVGGKNRVTEQEAMRERRELLNALRSKPWLQLLAANPLLLTILVLMKRQGITLPQRRVELYDSYIETLLRTWNLARSQRHETESLDVLATIRILAPLALWMHENTPGVGLVKEAVLYEQLTEIFASRDAEKPKEAAQLFLEDMRRHAALLLDRGGREYGFIHLTFQEYLAAVAIAKLGQRTIEPIVTMLSDHIDDPRWHEVSLLTIGHLGIIEQRDEVASAVLEALIWRTPGKPGEAEILAGEAVLETWPSGITPRCRREVIHSLLTTIRDDTRIPPERRAVAGRVLARLGDPRDEVMTLYGIQFCYISAGPFWMGSPKADEQADDDEFPLHEVFIDYDYWMARYPITNAQYEKFVEAGGYTESRYWQEAEERGWWTAKGFKGYRENQPRTKQVHYGIPYMLPNHPVVGISWYEALAFTRWLTEMWLQAKFLPEGWSVVLPSEPEWEKGARGGQTLPAKAIIVAIEDRLTVPRHLELKSNELAQRIYPWGNVLDPQRANYDETNIGTTCAVGCFMGGASPYGCEDMSGNVWEWTRSIWSQYPYPSDPQECLEREDASLYNPRMMRSGSFANYGKAARCAYHIRNHPTPRLGHWGFRVVISALTP